MRRLAVLAVLAAACGGVENADPAFESTDDALRPEGARVFAMKDARPSAGSHKSALLKYHNGGVLTATGPSTVHPIWWGSEWTNATFAGDKISGMETFFSGLGGSNYAGTVTEYYEIVVGVTDNLTRNVAFGGSIYDTSAAPASAISVSQAVAEVCKMTGNAPDASGMYFIFTSTGAGNVNYCAWHSYGNCSNGAPLQVAYAPNLDGISGCNPDDTWTTHSEGLAALANVAAHELSETNTDPRFAGWSDSSGSENGDKCAWAFEGPVTLANSTVWKLQMEWSNNAYTSGTGYPNLSGQLGCLQGQ